MSNTRPRVIMAGGGTGGHLYPALAIAEEIAGMRPQAQFLFVGSKEKIEGRIVPKRGYRFEPIWISGVHRDFRLSNILVPFKVVGTIIQSLYLFRRFKPDVVIGTGGYVCGPVLLAAAMVGIPTIVHESNSSPGVTTRLLARLVRKVFVSFEATARALGNTERIELVGTPTREHVGNISREHAHLFFGLDPARRTVLVFGGSLGAPSINSAVLEYWGDFAAHNVQLIWQTGERDFDRVQSALGSVRVGWVGPYIDAMEQAYAAADVVVCRSGATTVAELTRAGKPAVLVPYPRAAADHQTSNALLLAEAGAAVHVPDAEGRHRIYKEVTRLLDDQEARRAMAAASAALGRPHAGQTIAERALAMI